MGEEGFGIDPKVLDRMAQEIKELIEMGIQVGLSYWRRQLCFEVKA